MPYTYNITNVLYKLNDIEPNLENYNLIISDNAYDIKEVISRQLFKDDGFFESMNCFYWFKKTSDDTYTVCIMPKEGKKPFISDTCREQLSSLFIRIRFKSVSIDLTGLGINSYSDTVHKFGYLFPAIKPPTGLRCESIILKDITFLEFGSDRVPVYQYLSYVWANKVYVSSRYQRIELYGVFDNSMIDTLVLHCNFSDADVKQSFFSNAQINNLYLFDKLPRLKALVQTMFRNSAISHIFVRNEIMLKTLQECLTPIRNDLQVFPTIEVCDDMKSVVADVIKV